MGMHATLKYLKMTPRKVQSVADGIRGKAVSRAFDILAFSRRRAAKPLSKLLKSAVVNASAVKGIDVDTLVVKELRVNEGPTAKRWLPRSRGSATPILKRTSHVTIVLGERK